MNYCLVCRGIGAKEWFELTLWGLRSCRYRAFIALPVMKLAASGRVPTKHLGHPGELFLKFSPPLKIRNHYLKIKHDDAGKEFSLYRSSDRYHSMEVQLVAYRI